MGTFFWGVIGILILVGIGRAIYDWFRKQPEPDWRDIYGHQDWIPHKSGGRSTSDKYADLSRHEKQPYRLYFEQWAEEVDDATRIIHCVCPDPVEDDFNQIRVFLNTEYRVSVIEKYLEDAKNMHASAEVIDMIEKHPQYLKQK